MSEEQTNSHGSVVVGGDVSINTAAGDQEQLIVGQEHHHYPLPVIPALYAKLLLLIVLPAGGFLVPVLHRVDTGTDAFSALQYLHVIIWGFVMMLTWYIKAEHKKSRILGYHDFYNTTRHLHRITFYILSGGNVILIVLGSVVKDYCLGNSSSRCSLAISLTPVTYQQIIFFLEIFFAIPFVIKHIVDVVRFNIAEAPPDTLAEDVALRFTHPDSYVGVRGPSNLERVLERQADLLQVLRHRNSVLTRQVYLLSQQIHQA
ncbi:transmembrane protein 192-like [Homarus americanus]|uniref:Transmembrane protein 192 n=1 Tax=Homarus americanus TaxID=6706 RepID=A0A8J5K2Z4_HOMAM|nr:transmembrane protein 192-like [Homarus americanus]KAG7163989.1 Transmembrane protein 192-like [Homarus americanus]